MKRYALIVYKAKYGWDNYTDDIYRSGKYDTKEDTVIIFGGNTLFLFYSGDIFRQRIH